ncbi:hypothetical protein AAVH_23792 [Aphelenchoides avenae]|nr:hypothetical protein AAVH_23792 [Aphelenchus avenae]
MSTGELSTAIALELPWVRFLDVVFAYETILFIPLIYLVVFKSRNMPEYRWCLTTNVVSMYAFVVGIYLYKPFVLAEGYYFVPLGVVSQFGAEGHFYFLIGVNFLTTCHGLAIAICLLYQAVQMPAAWMAKAPEVVIGFVFRSKTRFVVCYFGMATCIWLMVAAYFLQANVDLDPLNKISTGKRVYH